MTHDLDRFDIKKKQLKKKGKSMDTLLFIMTIAILSFLKKINGIIVMSILIFVQVSLVIIKLVESIVFLNFFKT